MSWFERPLHWTVIALSFVLLAAVGFGIVLNGNVNALKAELEYVQIVLTSTQGELADTEETLASTQGELTSTQGKLDDAEAELLLSNIKVTNLSISPYYVEPGEEVTISANVANSGGIQLSYTAILRINDSEVERKSVVLDAGESEVVIFTMAKASTGNYTVELGVLAGTFTVEEAPPPIIVPDEEEEEPSPSSETDDCMCYSYTLKKYIPCSQATAICRDGTCSISKSRSGTCSYHGGVARWID